MQGLFYATQSWLGIGPKYDVLLHECGNSV